MKKSANNERFVSAWQWFYDHLFTMRAREVRHESWGRRHVLFTSSHRTLINVTHTHTYTYENIVSR